MNTVLDDLLLSLAGAPALPGARCRGKPHLFDPPTHGESSETAAARHFQALGLCSRCPALNQCRAWIASLPKGQRPKGVVAGKVSTGQHARPPLSEARPDDGA